MLLYAGNTYASYIGALPRNYSILNGKDIVKTLRVMSQSAGNSPIKPGGTSETIRNNNEHIKCISNHVPTHLKPHTDDQLGHYLAGLIDGNGYFTRDGHLVIHLHDVRLAYQLKHAIGYGRVLKHKTIIYCLTNQKGLLRVNHLIKGKLKATSFDLNTNYWLAGFIDMKGSFDGINLLLEHQSKDLLEAIKATLGGNISYINEDTYRYKSSSYGSAKRVINYLDRYHLQSCKHRSYLRWRKAYIIAQKKVMRS